MEWKLVDFLNQKLSAALIVKPATGPKTSGA
jgi:hypothetical protein